MKHNTKQLLAIVGVIGATALSASAELSIAPLTSAITANVTVVEGLVAAGFVVTALFIAVKLIKKGAAKIG